ncbi:MAG: phosphoenolpyruvate--protein phosphotransferase, partial [Gammaproteobacteria bacterium]|nr:phosphoenolpyruvate--protein phosphotransferase [Gammaproteobacteria bacterium]
IEQELDAFKIALKATRKDIAKLGKGLSDKVKSEERALFDAYLQILDSPSLKRDTKKEIRAGNWAPGALKRVIKQRVLQFEAMEDEYLRERAFDILDLGERVLAHLQISEQKARIRYPKQTILVGEKITPAAIAKVPADRLVGIVSRQGSHGSHIAILARALGVPTIMGVDEGSLANLHRKEAIIDGYYGQLYITPCKEVREEFAALAVEEQALNDELMKLKDKPAQTLDDHSVSLLVNTGLPVDIGHSLTVGADGVGLYRSEMPFMVRDRFPTEEEQYILYRQLLKVFAPRPVVMRTLDIGGDKCLPYFQVKEDNPFLGWRGIRISLDHPEIFLVQVRAMLRASLGLDNLQIMLPMISSLAEVESAIRLIKQAYNELIEEQLDIKMPKIGVMVEVPSAVYQAQALAQRVDFLSVGSNDLTQYLLAVDRNNARVSHLYDSLHPAVINALLQITTAVHRERNKTVSICGEIAGDPVAIVLLLAMGFDALSMNANQVLRAKWLIRKFTLTRAKELLNEVKKMDDAVDIRYHLEAALEAAGCAGLIRAGK